MTFPEPTQSGQRRSTAAMKLRMNITVANRIRSANKLLDVSRYDAAEAAAIDRYSNRIIQAFYPELFATVNYPVRVTHLDQLWRYIDVMHETQADHLIDDVLQGMTADEFELYKRVTKIVDRHATEHFGMRAHATAALLRAIHALRLIKIATGDARPTVLEVGPGCGYLAMLLVMEGYPYIGTDVTQAFYLYQSHLLAHVAGTLRELVTEDADILTVDQPTGGTAVHIPWWKWVTLAPEKIRLKAGIMTSNHVLCEMHPSSAAYTALVARQVLSSPPGNGKFIFDNWGSVLLHDARSVAAKFAEHGLQLCHDEHSMSAMVLQGDAAHWTGAMPALPQKSPDAAGRRRSPGWRSIIRRPIGKALDLIPPLKQLAIMACERSATLSPLVVNGVHPLSTKLMEGREAIFARATIRKTNVHEFLASYFGGDVPPQSADDIFLSLCRPDL
jgi:hypothetical protein